MNDLAPQDYQFRKRVVQEYAEASINSASVHQKVRETYDICHLHRKVRALMAIE